MSDTSTSAAPAPLGGDAPAPTGTPRVDILRELNSVDLGQQGANALRLWAIGNELPAAHGWPLRIDWQTRTITYWPDVPGTVTDHAQLDPRRVPLKRVPLAPLWRSLADHGALWCANPAHRGPLGTDCPERVDVRGEHATFVEHQTLADREPRLIHAGAAARHPHPDELLEQFVRLALERAAQGCEHPDPGSPIYESDRGCAQCGATAVMDLFRTADALEAFRARHTPPTVGYWEAGKGHRYPGHPGGFRPI